MNDPIQLAFVVCLAALIAEVALLLGLWFGGNWLIDRLRGRR